MPVTHLAFQADAESTFSRSTTDSESVSAFYTIANAKVEPFGLTLVNATSNANINVDLALMSLTDEGFIANELLPDEAPSANTAVISEDLADHRYEDWRHICY